MTPTHTPQHDQPRTDTPPVETKAFVNEVIVESASTLITKTWIQPVQVVDFYREAACSS